MGGLTRREFVKTAGGAAALAVGAGAVGVPRALAAAAPKKKSSPIVGVDVSQHPVPFFDNLLSVVSFDQTWLDAQAQGYWDTYASGLNRPLTITERLDFARLFTVSIVSTASLIGSGLLVSGDVGTTDSTVAVVAESRKSSLR